jgi:hypothetical protein
MTDRKTETSAADSTPPAGDAAKKPTDGKATGSNKSVWMGTAVGIGSAAIVAALLYTQRRK